MPEPALAARALEHLRARNVDPFTAKFADVKGGDLERAAMFAARVVAEHGAFWFPQRELRFGGALGFAHVLMALDPAELTGDLDQRERELRDALKKVSGERALRPEEYRAMFDPGFLQFLVVDPARARAALSMTAGHAVSALREGVASAGLDPVQSDALDDAWVRPLQSLDQARSLDDQKAEHPRPIEQFVRLYCGVSATVPAAEELWADVALPHLVGRPSEPRLLGAFRPQAMRALVDVRYARLHQVDVEDVRAALESFAPADDESPATARLVELKGLLPRLSLGPFALAFRRMTEVELPREAAARAVNARLSAR